MATQKQKKLAREIVKNLELDSPKTLGELVENGGYAEVMKKNPKRVIDAKGVKDELEVLGFTEEAAKGVVASILHHSDNDMARLKAADQIFKVQGSYAPEKHQNMNVNVDIGKQDPKEEQIILNAEEELKKLYES